MVVFFKISYFEGFTSKYYNTVLMLYNICISLHVLYNGSIVDRLGPDGMAPDMMRIT